MAVKTIGNIVLVTCLLQFMFAVIGVQLFKVGTLHHTVYDGFAFVGWDFDSRMTLSMGQLGSLCIDISISSCLFTISMEFRDLH